MNAYSTQRGIVDVRGPGLDVGSTSAFLFFPHHAPQRRGGESFSVLSNYLYICAACIGGLSCMRDWLGMGE